MLNITYNENTKNASYQVQQKVGVCMNTIITIGRQFGSAGREIGEKVAEYFGIKCYDKELLTRAAQESGFCEEMIQNHDERPTNSFLYNLVMDTYSFGYNASSFVDMPISHKVFLAQFDTIKKIADEGGMSVDEVKKHYDDPRAKEYLIDDTKENKLYDQLYNEVKVTKGDKMTFRELFEQK